MTSGGAKRWLPLEANPEVMNEFSRKLGLPASAAFHDVFGLDDELLAMVPQPVLAVLLLFPVSHQAKEAEAEASRGSSAGEAAETTHSVFFMKQTIRNACGTVGLLHAIGNNTEFGQLQLAPNSFFANFFHAAKSMTPAERGRHLEESAELESAHSSAATAGDTRAPSIDEDTDLHFVAFIHSNGSLYELDGNQSGPVKHGASTPATLLQDAARVIKCRMDRNPTSLRFNVIAMSNEDS